MHINTFSTHVVAKIERDVSRNVLVRTRDTENMGATVFG